MKKLFFTLALALGVFSAANAQEVGKFWVGGNVGFSSSKVKGADDSKTKFTIMPEFGYVITDKMGVGVEGGYTQTKLGDNKTDGYKVGAFVRYSLLKGDIGGIFVDGGLSYGQDTDKYTNSAGLTIEEKLKTFRVGFRPGVSINVASNVALTAKFGELGYKNQKQGDTKINTFGFDLNMENALFGVNFIF